MKNKYIVQKCTINNTNVSERTKLLYHAHTFATTNLDGDRYYSMFGKNFHFE